jgi:rhodanese-related sulfurtransferase
MVHEITPLELKARRDAGDHPLVIDVREGWEVEQAALPDTLHIPMNEIPDRIGELDATRETIVMCRSGGRSMRVAMYLESRGFQNVANLAGGILAWSEDVDPSLQAG